MEELKSIGTIFKEEREKKKVSIEEVSKITKLSKSIILAIENDNFEDLPGGFFNRGILRTYAEFLEIDSKKILEMYEKTFRKREENGNKILKVKENFKPIFFSKKMVILIITLIILLFFIWLLIPKGFSKKDFREMQKLKKTSIKKSFEREKESKTIGLKKSLRNRKLNEKEVKINGSTQYYDNNILNINIIFNDQCWVEMKKGNNIIVSRLFYKGEKFKVKGKVFTIKFGNPGAVVLFINNKKYSFDYKDGIPKTLNLNIKQLSEFLKR